jgi:type II secretory pathway component PulK
MIRREEGGFALITVLWLITALTAVVGLSIADTRLENRVSINRIVLARGRWAGDGCAAIAQARWAEHRLSDSATIDLGHALKCRWNVSDPASRINVNVADPELLRQLGLSATVVERLVEGRRRDSLESVEELRDLPGLGTTLLSLLTVEGTGSVNLSTAPRRILGALPGLGPEAVDRLLYARANGAPVTSLEQLAVRLSPPARDALLAHYADLARIATFSPPLLVLLTTGWVDGEPAHAETELLCIPLPGRLAVVRRRTW